MRREFPDLFYICTPGYAHGGREGYHFATWSGISGDTFHGRFPGGDRSLISKEWLKENIQEILFYQHHDKEVPPWPPSQPHVPLSLEPEPRARLDPFRDGHGQVRVVSYPSVSAAFDTGIVDNASGPTALAAGGLKAQEPVFEKDSAPSVASGT